MLDCSSTFVFKSTATEINNYVHKKVIKSILTVPGSEVSSLSVTDFVRVAKTASETVTIRTV